MISAGKRIYACGNWPTNVTAGSGKCLKQAKYSQVFILCAGLRIHATFIYAIAEASNAV